MYKALDLQLGPLSAESRVRVLTSTRTWARHKWGYFRRLPTMFNGSEPMDYTLPCWL